MGTLLNFIGIAERAHSEQEESDSIRGDRSAPFLSFGLDEWDEEIAGIRRSTEGASLEGVRSLIVPIQLFWNSDVIFSCFYRGIPGARKG